MPVILIIDDALFSRTVVRRFFKPYNCTILEAENGRQGFEMAKKHRPDCICLDMLLPEMTGIEVLMALKKENLHIPTIVITADTQETTRQKCLLLCAKAVLNKPPKTDALKAVLSSFLSLDQQEQT